MGVVEKRMGKLEVEKRKLEVDDKKLKEKTHGLSVELEISRCTYQIMAQN